MSNSFILFKQIIREGSYTNTYKMAWAKAIVELSAQTTQEEDEVIFTLEEIAEKFLSYYWNQTIFFDLIQGSNLTKPAMIVTIVKDMIEKYEQVTHTLNPILYEKCEVELKGVHLQESYNEAICQVIALLKKDVSYRFVYLDGKSYNEIYDYEKGSDSLIIKQSLVKQLKENERDVYDLINYRWGMILETFNSSPRINKKVKIMDEREIKRSSLNKFKRFLDLENPNHICFSCGKKTSDQELAIDHVIPWTYMYSDDLWNLVYSCQSCNSRKSNRVPTVFEIQKLKDRNKMMQQKLQEEDIKSKFKDELELAIEKDYVDKFWIGSKK